MAWTRPGTVTTSDFISAATWNSSAADTRDVIHKAPAAHVYASADIDIATATPTNVGFDSEYYDTDGMHDVSTNNDRLTVQTAGVYALAASARFESAGGTTQRYLAITVNSTAIVYQNMYTASLAVDLSVNAVYKLAANDIVRLVAYQASGGSIALQYNAALPVQMSAQWLGAGTA